MSTLSSAPDSETAAGAADETVAGLTRVLARVVRALGDAGQPSVASQFAAQGWALLRDRYKPEAERLNGAMHYLSKQHPSSTQHPADGEHVSAHLGDHLEATPMTTNAPELDVRTEPPARRHELIFETYAALTPGAAFELVNDHDPKPLYYQLAAEHPDEFSWVYVEEGPEVWRVRIGRVAEGAAAGS